MENEEKDPIVRPKGLNNSSRYRVRPMMEAVVQNEDALGKLLSLVRIPPVGRPTEYYYDGAQGTTVEKQLKPSKRHLAALIAYMGAKIHTKPTANRKRHALYYPDPATPNSRAKACLEALTALEESYDTLLPTDKDWFIFEGFTNPDFYMEGKDFVILGEGKWTEAHRTVTTANLCAPGESRDQMVRHIQGALNATAKKVYAFYIVEEGCGYEAELTKDSFARILEAETVPIPSAEKKAILDAYCGYTTWQAVAGVLPYVTFKPRE